jgi:isopentenyl-diphosphate delta-isomerase
MQRLIPAWIDGTLQPVEKLRVHRDGLRHKAVSIFVFCQNQLLIQRRALEKYHTPGLWANTCCTHPNWDESEHICAERRLDEELGLTNVALTHVGRVAYRADVGGGMIEHEVVEMFVGHLTSLIELRPNPAEVCETRWVEYQSLEAEMNEHPKRFTPWFKLYVQHHASKFWPSAKIKHIKY